MDYYTLGWLYIIAHCILGMINISFLIADKTAKLPKFLLALCLIGFSCGLALVVRNG